MPVTASRRRRFTVDEYYQMAEAGVFHPEERVELIEGEIIEMAAIGSRHAATVKRLLRLFAQEVGDRAVVQIQDPVRLSDLTEPEPDVALLRPRWDDYASAHPRPDDTLLLVEVADTTVELDRERKGPLYAAAGIPEYWLVDLPGSAVEVFRRPVADSYETVQRLGPEEVLHPEAFPDIRIQVSHLLP